MFEPLLGRLPLRTASRNLRATISLLSSKHIPLVSLVVAW
jgi:hypothetical protein